MLSIKSFRQTLKLPALLESMIESGTWRHPGADVLRRAIPFITDPLIILKTFDHMLSESGPLMGKDAIEEERFSEYRGSRVAKRELPWIDVEKTLFIMCNEIAGDDVGIALDYREDLVEPRVIGGDWHSQPGKLVYHTVATSFAEFAMMIGLHNPLE